MSNTFRSSKEAHDRSNRRIRTIDDLSYSSRHAFSLLEEGSKVAIQVGYVNETLFVVRLSIVTKNTMAQDVYEGALQDTGELGRIDLGPASIRNEHGKVERRWWLRICWIILEAKYFVKGLRIRDIVEQGTWVNGLDSGFKLI